MHVAQPSAGPTRGLPDTVFLAVFQHRRETELREGGILPGPLPCWFSPSTCRGNVALVGGWCLAGFGRLTLGQRLGSDMSTVSGGCWGVGGRLPFAERHPPVVDADGAIAEASHDEGAVRVTGQACHAAVSARGDVLGVDTGTVVRAPNSGRSRHHPGTGALPSAPEKAWKAQGA